MKINLQPILDLGVRIIGLFLILFLSVEADRLKQQTITPMLLQLEWINKWDGKLPSTQLGSGNGLMYNINK